MLPESHYVSGMSTVDLKTGLPELERQHERLSTAARCLGTAGDTQGGVKLKKQGQEQRDEGQNR